MREKQLISNILQLISIKSFTHDQEGIRKCQNYIMHLASSMELQTELHGKEKVLIIKPKGLVGRAKIGLVTHIDTVPFDEREWLHNPLGEISNSKIYGRGVLDDKGPTIMAMHAVYELKHSIEDSWEIIIGSSEEGEWIDMQEFLAENPVLPEFLVTIDGDGVQNGCRGYSDLVLKFKRQTSTTHITNFYVPNGIKNTVPAKAVCKIDEIAEIAVGKDVHSSIPEHGKNALMILANIIRENYAEAYYEYSMLFDFLAKLTPTCNETVLGIPAYVTNSGVGTSVSATMASMEEDYITINLNIRIGPGRTLKDIEKAIIYLMEEYGCEVSIDKFIMPSFVDTNQKEFQAMCEAYEEVIGKKANINIAHGLGYNAALPNCAIFGPRFDLEHDNEPDTCHQIDECRSIDNLLKFYDILKRFLKKTL